MEKKNPGVNMRKSLRKKNYGSPSVTFFKRFHSLAEIWNYLHMQAVILINGFETVNEQFMTYLMTILIISVESFFEGWE